MALTSIVYNGLALNSGAYVVNDLDDSAPFEQVLALFMIARANGAKVTDDQVGIKPIKIIGKIIGSSVTDLEQKIDALNLANNGHDKLLDVGYAGSTRRYLCTPARRPIIDRPVRAANWASFELNLVATDYAYDTTTTTLSNTSISTATTLTFDIGGNAPEQFPRVQVTLTAITPDASNTVYIGNPDTGQQMSITRTWVAGDVIVIDPKLQSVKVNGVETEFDGPFLVYEAGTGRKMAISGNFSLSTTTDTLTASANWQAPIGVTSATVAAIGAGGGGGTRGAAGGGGGGGGGGYASSILDLDSLTSYAVVVGLGGTAQNAGGDSSFDTNRVYAKGGMGGGNTGFGTGGGASPNIGNIGTTVFNGGRGGTGANGAVSFGAGGGEAASATAAGNNGSGTGSGAGGTGTAGADGGQGAGAAEGPGANGNIPGGGAGGAKYVTTTQNGGTGGRGQVAITYNVPSFTFGVIVDQVKYYV